MPTTADYLNALSAARDELAQNITQNGGTVSGMKFNQLAQDVAGITWGEKHFLTGSGTVNRDGIYYPSAFTVQTAFVPARITLNFPLVLAGTFSDDVQYKMIGRLTLSGIEANNGLTQTHTVELSTGMGQVETVSVTTQITQTDDGWSLTVTLPTTPTRYVFRGTFDWLCVDAEWEGDAE